MKILVTGAAGFIGFHVAKRLLEDGADVLGIDNLNAYYDPGLKRDRLARLLPFSNFRFMQRDIAERSAMEQLFSSDCFEVVIHLAAQAGVRHSIENPHSYIESNVTGFLHVLEGVRHGRARHLIYASSSSVYGQNRKIPFSVGDRVDHPMSLYAATKRADELMATCYAHLYKIPATGLRFFTVYGPWGRPDMAPFRFVQAILKGQPIDVYNYGRMKRDFTYIDDIVEGVARLTYSEPRGCRLFNIGNGCPVELIGFIGELERALGRRARKRFLPMQAGDVASTHANVDEFTKATGFRPNTSLSTGVAAFVDWYRSYFGDLSDEYRTHACAHAVLRAS